MGSLVTRAGGQCILMCRLRKRALAAFTEVYFPPAAILTGIKTETNLPIQAELTEVHYRFVFPSPLSVRCWPLPAAQTHPELPSSEILCLFPGSGVGLNCSKPSPLLLLLLDGQQGGVLGVGTVEP